MDQTSTCALTKTFVSNPRVEPKENNDLVLFIVILDWEAAKKVDASSLI